jgi:hypothetical protein
MSFFPQTQVLKDLSNDVPLVNEANLCGTPHKLAYVKRLIM